MVQKKLLEFSKYQLGNTPLICASEYCPSKNLFVKIEKNNLLGSIKDRVAYFIFCDLLNREVLRPGMRVVESSSGNLGLSLNFFARELGVDFLCLIDPTLPYEKVHQLENNKVRMHTVSLGSAKTYRDARIHLAGELDAQAEWIWTRQYDNPANVLSHYKSTGPEIWSQTNNNVDIVVCSIGTGGTICGIGLYLKEKEPNIKIVAVEPLGSTIFGGVSDCYLSVGSGMSCASVIVKNFGFVVDYWVHIADIEAINACREFLRLENISVGVTAGAALAAAKILAKRYPNKKVVSIAPDGGENYSGLINDDMLRYSDQRKIIFHKCKESKKWKLKSLGQGKIT